jgi:hypothetical protein
MSGRLRQEKPEFKAILGYIARPCLKKKKKKAGMEEKGVTWGNLKVGEEKAAPELSGRCDLGTQRVCILTL